MNEKFSKLGFYPADILLPNKDVDMEKWAVVACDQFTSEPEYWERVEKTVGDAPSTLRLILPEANLKAPNVDKFIADINASMDKYLKENIFETLKDSLIYIERGQSDGKIRHGLIGMVDLDQYDFTPGSGALIRATEGTVLDRIPPRARVRRNAPIELPHVMLLIDDPDKTVIEPLTAAAGTMEKLYDFDLMQNGGHITGWFLPNGPETEAIEAKLEALCDRETFNAKYGCTDAQALLPYAVGDGNHSMATAKAYWEEVKKGLTPEEQENHPARFALAEIVNIHDESIIIEPIHRALFGVDGEELLKSLTAFYEAQGCKAYVADNAPETEGAHFYPFVSAEKNGVFVVEDPKWAIPVATIQTGLDAFLAEHKDVKIDFIHGADVVVSLAEKKGMTDEMNLIELVEKLTPEVFAEKKGSDKPMCANVDMYSGFVYRMLGLPKSLYTPLFATARIVGWMAHRLEEVTTGGKIIRPAYRCVQPAEPYISLKER